MFPNACEQPNMQTQYERMQDERMKRLEECNKNFKWNECRAYNLCWESQEPFTGGSMPWKGTKEQQKRQAEERAEAMKKGEIAPPCKWFRCHQAVCPQYSCSGRYDAAKHRPPCEAAGERHDPGGWNACAGAQAWTSKRTWCWKPEATLLPYCPPPQTARYYCPTEEELTAAAAPPTTPAPPTQNTPADKQESRERSPSPPRPRCTLEVDPIFPVFVWRDGRVFPNIKREPYPHLKELLEWKKFDKPEQPPERKHVLWSVACMPFIGDDPTYESCTGDPNKPCPGSFVRDTPLFLWKDGRPKENLMGLPYPGHGPRPFNPCLHALEIRKMRKDGPSRNVYTHDQQDELCRQRDGCVPCYGAVLVKNPAFTTSRIAQSSPRGSPNTQKLL